MSENVYMGMDLEQLQKTVNDLASASPINQTELDTARHALAQKMAGETEQKTEETESDKEFRYPHMKLFDMDAYARKYPETAEKNTLNSITHGIIEQTNNAVKEQLTAEYEEKIASLKTGFEEERTNWEFQNRKMQGELQEKEESNRLITEEKNKYKLYYEDIEPRFKALEQKYKEDMAEKDKENEQLREKIKELTDKTKENPKEIEKLISSEELNALIKKANEQQRIEEERKEAERLASRPKITNVRWKDDIKQKEYLAELVGDYPIGKDGQTIEFGRLDINMYQVMSEDDAARFRAEQAQQSAATAETSSEETTVPDTALVEIPEVQPVEDFRQTEAETVLPVCEPSDIRGVVPEAPVTRQEFEEVRKFVAKLQLNQDKTVTWNGDVA